MNMKLVTQNEVLGNAINIKSSILDNIVKMKTYMDQQFEQDVVELLKIFYNAAPFDIGKINKKASAVLFVLEFFNQKETLIHRVIKSLELGYVHHVQHITTGEMALELGISPQAIHAHIYDINDPVDVEKVKNSTKKKYIPVKKYPKLILAEKQDFDVFKEWFLDKKKGSE